MRSIYRYPAMMTKRRFALSMAIALVALLALFAVVAAPTAQADAVCTSFADGSGQAPNPELCPSANITVELANDGDSTLLQCELVCP